MLTLIGGLFLGWTLGANDSANVFGTGVTSQLIKFRTAVILISIFVIAGAIIEGPKCMQSISDLGSIGLNQAFICTLSAGIAMTILTVLAIPASTSQAIVGAIIGATMIHSTPNYQQLFKMVICWVLTPIGGAIIAFIMYLVVDFFVQRYIQTHRAFQYFLRMAMLVSGCYGAYALGANNVANTTGVYVNSGLLTAQQAALIGGIAIAIGAITYSKKVMMTVGQRITLIGPVGAVIATFSHSLTIHIYTQIGVPVSSSQAIVGAVIGIGLVRGIRAVNKDIIWKIFIGWFSTPVCSGVLAYAILRVWELFA